MTSIERTFAALIVLVALLVVGWIGVLRYGAEQYDIGYAAAVELGKKARDDQAEIYRKTEDALRAKLADKDATAFTKEKEHAASIEAAQRRMRTGADSLRCPTRPVPASATPADGPAAGGTAPDERGPEFVPEAAADVLGIAGHIAGLVRRYARLEERFDECQAMNAK